VTVERLMKRIGDGARPYSPEEDRVCDYLQRILPEIGCGDDPIGFLIASHEYVCDKLERAVAILTAIEGEDDEP
jgi:hypothetical protein